MGENGRVFTCPVCSSDELTTKPYEDWPPAVESDALTPPYEDVLGPASYEVCPSCGFEFGNDDSPGTATPVSFGEYRAEWIAAGSLRSRSR